MLTNKNRARSLWTALFLFVFSGCQPSGPKALLLGDKYVREGDYPKALRYLGRAAVFMPARPEVWNLEGLAYHGLQQPAPAAEAYQRALRIDRNFAPAHFNLGVLLLEQDRPADAATELNSYLALRPKDDEGWSRLGDALVRAHKTDEAERALGQALKLNNKNADAHNSLGLVHIQQKRPREAMQSFNAALQCRPGFGAPLLNQAIVAQQYFGNNQIALERYRAFLNSKPNPKATAAVQLAIRQIEQPGPERTAPVALADLTTNTGIGALLRSNLAKQVEQPLLTNAPRTTNFASQPPPALKTNPAPPEIAAARPTVPKNAPAIEPIKEAAPRPADTVVAAVPKQSSSPKEEEAEKPGAVEVVKVAQEPQLAAPKDLDLPAVASNNAIGGSGADRPLLAPRKKTDEEKRGLLARLKQANPVRWFEHDDSRPAATESTRQIAPVRTAPPVGEENSEAVPARVAPPVIPPPPVARYQYRTNPTVAKGSRVQADKLLAQAGSAYEQRRVGDALSLFRQAAVADPSSFEANYNLGVLAYQNKELPLALAADEQAVALKPNSPDARYNFALALRDAHYPVDAANEFRELLNHSPNEARAHLALGNIYAQQLDEPALARSHYQKFLELAPNHPDAAAVRQWLVMHP